MKKKTLYTLALGVLFMSVAAIGVMAADTPSKSRSGLYSRPVETASSLPSEATSSGLYSPLRANPTNPGLPGIEEGIGTAVPIGDMPGIILFGAAMAYLGFVFVRKQKELRVKN